MLGKIYAQQFGPDRICDYGEKIAKNCGEVDPHGRKVHVGNLAILWQIEAILFSGSTRMLIILMLQ